MSLPPGAVLVSGQLPMRLPPGATLVSNAPQAPQQAAAPQFPITQQPGESFADTMQRAVAAGQQVTPDDLAASYHEGVKKIPTVLTAATLAGPALIGATVAAPEAVSTATGGGVLGGAAGGAAGGAGTELIRQSLHAAAGEKVLTPDSLMDVLKASGEGAAIGGGLGLFDSFLGSKLARGAINESVGATARDVTYGNPAVGILDNGINSPFTGDLEAYKSAMRSGANPTDALVAAGGRTAQVAQRIKALAPQLDAALSKSTAQIPVSDVIDYPLVQAATDIINNRAMTEAEKMTAVSQLGALQSSLKEGLPDTLSPLQANQIKQAIGARVNWAGNVAVTDEVKPAYRAVYGALKSAVNEAVPEAAPINENLTNLLSAQSDLQKLMMAEEVGAGKGALGSAVTGIARRAEAVAGRGIPAIRTALPSAPTAGAVTYPTVRLSDLLGQ